MSFYNFLNVMKIFLIKKKGQGSLILSLPPDPESKREL